VVVRFCQAMCLFPGDDYEEVMRKLAGSLTSMGSWHGNWQVPTTSAITQARQRLGFEPLRALFSTYRRAGSRTWDERRLAGPASTYGHRRVHTGCSRHR
jgi:hypothetical protein